MITCRYEDGKEANLRHVTVDSIVVRGDTILLVRRARNYHIEPGKWVLPGGFLDRDESATQGAMREVLEETGYKSTESRLFLVIDTPRLKGDDRQNVSFVFLTSAGEKVQEPDFEIDMVEWFDLNSLPKEAEFGFDHYDMVAWYIRHLKKPHPLPYFNYEIKST